MAQSEQSVDLDALNEVVAKQQQESYNWTFANGRRYASSQLGHYFMPNDEPEIQRLNRQHWVLTEAKGGVICSAPIVNKPDLNILDLGCGSGIWCLQMAEDYPNASIVGADVSPIQPPNKPDNVEWKILDIEADWPFPENHFDLIHLSLVHGCVSDWPATVAKLKRYLRPGGFIEHQEFAMGTLYFLDEQGERHEASALSGNGYSRWPRLMCEASDKRGRTLHLGPLLQAWHKDAGMVDAHETVYSLAIGTWPSDPKQKAIGAQFLANVLNGFDGFTLMLFTKVLGWSDEDTKSFIEECKVDLRDNRIHKMIDVHVVYSRKPDE